MRTLAIHEILDKISKEKKLEDRIALLRHYDCQALRYILYYGLEPTIKWQLPEAAPEYKPCEMRNQSHILYYEAKKLYHFLEGGNPNLKQSKREYMFVELLESVDSQDAKLLLSIKNKKIPYRGINRDLVNKAFDMEFISAGG